MRTTYLVKSDSPEMNGALVEITGEEWYEITKLNASLPKQIDAISFETLLWTVANPTLS